MPPKLSPRTRQLVDTLFDPTQADEAAAWLEDECGNNLPFCQGHDELGMERIRFAAIKWSEGDLPRLLKAIDEARMDWRDLLMAAGFGYEVDAHNRWAEDALGI